MLVFEQPVGVLPGLASRDLLGDEGDGDAVRRALKEARRLIARGWVQGAFWDGDAVCLTAAIWFAAGGGAIFRAALGLLHTEMVEKISFMEWNDRPGRTQAEVLALLDRALATLEEGRRR